MSRNKLIVFPQKIYYSKRMKIDIDAQTEIRLKEIAACGNSSPEALAAEMLAQQIQDKEQARYWRERVEDMVAIQCYRETGKCVSQEAMSAKLDKMIEDTRALAQNMDK